MTQARIKVRIHWTGGSKVEEYDLHKYGADALVARNDTDRTGAFTKFYRYVMQHRDGHYTMHTRRIGQHAVEFWDLVTGPGGTAILCCGEKLVAEVKARLKS